MQLDDQTILLTGASSGIGRATALALAGHGNRIAITARREELLVSAAREIEARGSQCRVFAGDATDAAFCAEVVDAVVAEFGGLDIAVLNIGHGPPSNTLTASAATITGCMRTNYDTMINYFCPVLAQMRRQAGPCLIAHVNSLATYFGLPMQGDYTAAKSAGRIFLETARMELKHFGLDHIRIQTIHPGFVRTQSSQGDGIPEPHQISEDQAAEYILQGLQKEMRENLFPLTMGLAVRLGRVVPHWLLTRLLLREMPPEY